MSVYRVFIKEIIYLDVEADNSEHAGELAFKEFQDPGSEVEFEIMGVGVHVMPFDEWRSAEAVIH
jgi:hypothetical protein